ncbi:MAG: ABC transporter permease [Lachnospiraceae bacterium]|nr:ABC transporter permease [Lachnospiraceae bacterium]
MNGVKYIISKEFARVFKDRKLVFSLFILPAVLMIGLYSLIGSLAGSMSKDIKEHVSTVYIQNVPEEIKSLIKTTGYDKLAKITYLQGNASNVDEIKDDILNGDAELLVIFDKNFSEDVKNFKTPSVTIGYNSAKDYSQNAYSTFNQVIANTYSQTVIAERIGGAEKLTVFKTVNEEIVKEDEKNGQFLAMLIPYLITFLIFASAMGIVTDAIAGEKERGTMARLLMTPVKRSHLAFGKLVSLSGLSIISAIVYAVSMALAMPMMMKTMTGGSTVGFAINFRTGQLLELVVLLVILAYLYVALISALSIRAKDVKTASTYVSPLYIVIMVAALMTMFTGSRDVDPLMHAIPVYGTALSVQKIMTNSLGVVEFLYSVAGNLVLAVLCTVSVTKSFCSEKIMFNA